MPQEIEHKYLVRLEIWQPSEPGVLYRQGYLSTAEARVVRVRIAGEEAFLTVKGPSHGITRLELEYSIPMADAAMMLDLLCERPLIEKTRYRQSFAGKTWEIDVFHGDNAGLVVAEVEVASESELIEPPPWLGPEVSGDSRYFNSNLISNPYKNWRE
jgi:CYTH domain-containing protein